MKKMGLLKSENMGSYEKEQGYASYRTIVERYASDMVLCNNIIDIDTSVYDNMIGGYRYVDYETGEEYTQEDYNNDTTGKIEIEYEDVIRKNVMEAYYNKNEKRKMYNKV